MDFFTPTIKDVTDIRKALQHNTKRSCEFSVANTILWANSYHTQIAYWQDTILYRSRLEDGSFSYACNLLDCKDAKAFFDAIAGLAQEEGHPLQMHGLLPEEEQWIEIWYPGRYVVTYNRDYADYIYLQEKLSTLSGKRLHGKRNHIHRFEEKYPDWSYEAITADNEQECARMAMQWCMKNCVNEAEEIAYDKIDESKLVVYAIRHLNEFGMLGGALRVNGQIIAVTLGEPVTKDTFVVHFEKAFSDIQGAYPMINREFVRHALGEYMYVNREEDLGMEGLRKAKLSYRPEMLLEKGSLRERIR